VKSAFRSQIPDLTTRIWPLIYRIWVSLVELFAGNKAVARQFLNAPNRGLERRAPFEFIEAGDLGPLEMYVDAMTARQPI
jgi:uncharacterized protein (DUF2384 family)